ncbi:MAG: biosynthetic-type acetolactate synthase large subunit [Thermodesulfobacteriota bacterium]
MKRRTGAKIIFEGFLREGVEVIFGYPGGAVIHLYDELINHPQIKHVLVRHEQAAIHAADGYARATGKPGVCLVTSGPGATNVVTGVVTAFMDSIPIVVLTGQVATHQIGNDAFQEADILGITRTCTKHNYLVKNTGDLARVIREAFHIASTGRPGPVVVDLPKDVITGEASLENPERFEIRGYAPVTSGHPGQIKLAVREILKAKKPVIYAGGGIIHSGSQEELLALAELARIPVTVTLLGLGGFPGDHPLFLGMLGMHGTYAANAAITQCDLLIAIGSRFDDRVTGKVESFAPSARIIHVDIDPSSISKNVTVNVPIVGDAKNILTRMVKLLKEHGDVWQAARKPWLKEVRQYAAEHPLCYEPSKDVIKPQYVIEQIRRLTGGQAIIATEVGQHQMWTAQFYQFTQPRTILSSGGLGTMGYGLPAAIGAQVAFPGRIVFDIAGEGGFQMNVQELATAVQYRLPIKVAILNNHSLGMVRQWQELFFDKRYSETSLDVQPDFVRLAEAYGAVGLRADHPRDVVPCLEKALSIQGPVVMDFIVDPEENVFPMVPPGHGIDQMILAKPDKKAKKVVPLTFPS